MIDEILEKRIDDLSLEQLGEIVKTALSTIYRKLQTEEGFGYDQCCMISSIGSETYDVDGCVVDGRSHNSGLNWPRTFWF